MDNTFVYENSKSFIIWDMEIDADNNAILVGWAYNMFNDGQQRSFLLRVGSDLLTTTTPNDFSSMIVGVHPNPAIDRIWIELPSVQGTDETLMATFYDAGGRLFYKTQFQSSAQKEAINKEREDLSRKYNRAAAIQVTKLDATGYQNREGKKPSSKSKASDVDFIEVCFKTSENMNSDAGMEKFYIRIINPLGETESIPSEGSGTLTNNATGTQIKYSTVAMADYKNDEVKACGKFANPGAMQKGVYQVEVYNKGYLVGTTTLKLK